MGIKIKVNDRLEIQIWEIGENTKADCQDERIIEIIQVSESTINDSVLLRKSTFDKVVSLFNCDSNTLETLYAKTK